MQFGLVAEEVAQVFPELVVYGEDGEPETVSYHLLATLLLNEFQKERATSQSRALELAELKEQMAAMTAAVERLEHASPVAAIE
jgi:TfoX/Sxy family transcriptional regulator of competence genes